MLAAIAMAIADVVIAAFSISIVGIAMMAVLKWFVTPYDINIIGLGSFKMIIDEIIENPFFIVQVIGYSIVMMVGDLLESSWLVGNQMSCL